MIVILMHDDCVVEPNSTDLTTIPTFWTPCLQMEDSMSGMMMDVDPAPWKQIPGHMTSPWPIASGAGTPGLTCGAEQMGSLTTTMMEDSSFGLATEICGLFDNGKQNFYCTLLLVFNYL